MSPPTIGVGRSTEPFEVHRLEISLIMVSKGLQCTARVTFKGTELTRRCQVGGAGGAAGTGGGGALPDVQGLPPAAGPAAALPVAVVVREARRGGPLPRRRVPAVAPALWRCQRGGRRHRWRRGAGRPAPQNGIADGAPLWRLPYLRQTGQSDGRGTSIKLLKPSRTGNLRKGIRPALTCQGTIPGNS